METMHEGDRVRVKCSGHVGTLRRLKDSDRCGGGPWLVVGYDATRQPAYGKRDCELIYCPHKETTNAPSPG